MWALWDLILDVRLCVAKTHRVNITQLPSGSWRVEVSHKGQRRTATARTRTEAKQRGAELAVALGLTPRRSTVDVSQLLAYWLDAFDGSVTFRSDAVRVIGALPDSFTARSLDDVTPVVIEHLYRHLGADGYSVHRVRRVHTVLSSAWTMALRYEWASVNPFASAKKPAVPQRRVQAPSADDVRRLLNAADGVFALYLELAATIGARRGELVALQWGDVNGTTLDIHRALAYTAQSGIVEVDGKIGAKGHRIVSVSPQLAARLKTHRADQVKMALAHGLPSPLWVFSDTAGCEPWIPDTVSTRFRRLRTKVGLDHVRAHDLRHFMASESLAAGVPLSVVGDRLGHVNRATTSDTYGHLVPAADRQVADIMGRLLNG